MDVKEPKRHMPEDPPSNQPCRKNQRVAEPIAEIKSNGKENVPTKSDDQHPVEITGVEVKYSKDCHISSDESATRKMLQRERNAGGLEEQFCRTVAYIFDDEYLNVCDSLPKVKHRASTTHKLIKAYGLLREMKLLKPHPADRNALMGFHSENYLDCLEKLSNDNEDELLLKEADSFGLTYDCPAFRGVYEYACYIAGASIKAAQSLNAGFSKVAINWFGGWHHAKKDEASGFCYLNDAVLAILKLREKFDRVLYVDLDLHHGDGVEDAFCATSKVMTLSFHKVATGFFPGTGYLNDTGMGKGRFYTVNIPMEDGVDDVQYVKVFQRIAAEVRDAFQPSAVVCQCGADGLAGDPMACYNLTLHGLGECVKTLLTWNLPLLLLGGGGYNIPNTARCWTYLTGIALNMELPDDIPEHQLFTLYGPDYSLHIHPGNRPNQNNNDDVEEIIQEITENLKKIRY